MSSYIAVIHKEAESDYGVSFPDFPGCITAGRDLDEARTMAEEALALHLDGMAEDGEAIPEPSSLERVMSDPDNRGGVAILVPAPAKPRRSVRVNVSFYEDDLRAFDQYAQAHGLTRSGFLTDAARRAIRHPT